MAISAAQVKELRERTGAGMMECKKALVATDGDITAAVETMRREGLAKADKKAGRVAAEGRVTVAVSDDHRHAVLVEVNCETDFVGKNNDFVGFVNAVAECALTSQVANVDALSESELDGQSVEQRRRELISTLGENITLRRLHRVSAPGGAVAAYLHGNRIASVVAVEGGDEALSHNLAIHVAASAPQYLSADDVPAAVRNKERDILTEQARGSGKPDNIIEKMVEGRLRKYFDEVTLLGQPFVKDPDQSIAKLVSAAGAKIVAFSRFEVGEGIEKEAIDFAEEVKAQAQGSA